MVIGFENSTQELVSIALEDMEPSFLNILLDEDDLQNSLVGYFQQFKQYYIDSTNAQYQNNQQQLLFKKILYLLNNFSASTSLSPTSINLMSKVGARGTPLQLRQITEYRGFTSNARGYVASFPIWDNFYEGINPFEYFLATYGARKGIVDTGLRTADAGYLTRRLVELSQSSKIKEKKCYTKFYLEFHPMSTAQGQCKPLDFLNLYGKISKSNLLNQKDKSLFLTKGEKFTRSAAIRSKNLITVIKTSIGILSPLTCNLTTHFCQSCYGLDFSSEKGIQPNTVIGTLAAQSIGEPSTQMVLRTFHSGGAFSSQRTTNQTGDLKLYNANTLRPFNKLFYLSKNNFQHTLCTTQNFIAKAFTFFEVFASYQIHKNYRFFKNTLFCGSICDVNSDYLNTKTDLHSSISKNLFGDLNFNAKVNFFYYTKTKKSFLMKKGVSIDLVAINKQKRNFSFITTMPILRTWSCQRNSKNLLTENLYELPQFANMVFSDNFIVIKPQKKIWVKYNLINAQIYLIANKFNLITNLCGLSRIGILHRSQFKHTFCADFYRFTSKSVNLFYNKEKHWKSFQRNYFDILPTKRAIKTSELNVNESGYDITFPYSFVLRNANYCNLALTHNYCLQNLILVNKACSLFKPAKTSRSCSFFITFMLIFKHVNSHVVNLPNLFYDTLETMNTHNTQWFYKLKYIIGHTSSLSKHNKLYKFFFKNHISHSLNYIIPDNQNCVKLNNEFTQFYYLTQLKQSYSIKINKVLEDYSCYWKVKKLLGKRIPWFQYKLNIKNYLNKAVCSNILYSIQNVKKFFNSKNYTKKIKPFYFFEHYNTVSTLLTSQTPPTKHFNSVNRYNNNVLTEPFSYKLKNFTKCNKISLASHKIHIQNLDYCKILNEEFCSYKLHKSTWNGCFFTQNTSGPNTKFYSPLQNATLLGVPDRSQMYFWDNHSLAVQYICMRNNTLYSSFFPKLTKLMHNINNFTSSLNSWKSKNSFTLLTTLTWIVYHNTKFRFSYESPEKNFDIVAGLTYMDNILEARSTQNKILIFDVSGLLNSDVLSYGHMQTQKKNVWYSVFTFYTNYVGFSKSPFNLLNNLLELNKEVKQKKQNIYFVNCLNPVMDNSAQKFTRPTNTLTLVKKKIKTTATLLTNSSIYRNVSIGNIRFYGKKQKRRILKKMGLLKKNKKIKKQLRYNFSRHLKSLYINSASLLSWENHYTQMDYTLAFTNTCSFSEIVAAGENKTLDQTNFQQIIKCKFPMLYNFSTLYRATRYVLHYGQSLLLGGLVDQYRRSNVKLPLVHYEVIIKRLSSLVRVIDSGDTNIIISDCLDFHEIHLINRAYGELGFHIAFYYPIIVGMTRTTLYNNGFLSSLAFRFSVNLLKDAVIKSKTTFIPDVKSAVLLGQVFQNTAVN